MFKYYLNADVGALLAVSYLFALYAVIRTNIVPGKYLGLAILVSGITVAALLFAHFKMKLSKPKRIGLIVTSALVTIVSIIIFIVGSATTNFLDGIHDDGYSYEQYDIVAKTDRHIKLATSHQTAGILDTDTNNVAVKTEVDKRTNVTYKTSSDPTSMSVDIENNTTDMMVLKKSYMDLLKENDTATYGHLEVLATFTIKVKRTTNTVTTDMTKPFVLYISGIDTYGDIATVSRSDVNILAVVNPVTQQILLVNTPRDYYVQLHGTTGNKDKLTHAGIYGIDMSVATMQDLYGVTINYSVRINFSSLVKLVDTLGGVDVDSDYDFTAEGHTFTVGNNHLSGDQALTFSRERHSFEGGDRTRGENQLRVIQAIIAKMSTPSTLVNYQKILSALQGVVQTNMSTGDMTTLFRNQLDDMAKWHTSSVSVDGTGATDYTYSMGNIPLYVMVPDQATVQTAKDKIQQSLSQ